MIADTKIRDNNVLDLGLEYNFNDGNEFCSKIDSMTSRIKELERLLIEKDAEVDQLRTKNATKSFDQIWDSTKLGVPQQFERLGSPHKVNIVKVDPVADSYAALNPAAATDNSEQDLFWNTFEKFNADRRDSKVTAAQTASPESPLSLDRNFLIDTPASIKSALMQQQRQHEDRIAAMEAESQRKLNLVMRHYKKLKAKYESLQVAKLEGSGDKSSQSGSGAGSAALDTVERITQLAAICNIPADVAPDEAVRQINSSLNSKALELKKILQLYKSGTASLLELQTRIREAHEVLETLHSEISAASRSRLKQEPVDEALLNQRLSRARSRSQSPPDPNFDWGLLHSRLGGLNLAIEKINSTKPVNLCISLERESEFGNELYQRRFSLDGLKSELPHFNQHKFEKKTKSLSPVKQKAKYNEIHTRPFYL